MAQGSAERGVKFSLLVLGPHNPPEWIDEVPEVEFHSLGATSRAQYPLAILRLGRLIKATGIDILHVHLFYPGLVSVFAKTIFHRPAILAIMRHHTSVMRLLGTRTHVALDRWMARRADKLLTVSKSARAYMRDVDHIDRDIEVLYLGFDFQKMAPDAEGRRHVRDEFGYGPESFVIGYVGSMAPGKGHVQLLEAFARISEHVPEARLLLVGGSRSRDVDEAVERLSVESKVTFTGYRDDVAACLNAMDIFVQPSLSEAFSQVLIEAMGVALPTIATDVGSAREVIIDGENGFLVPPNDPQAIADRISELYGDAPRAHRLGENARRSVVERFTLEQMVDHHYKSYQRWLENVPES